MTEFNLTVDNLGLPVTKSGDAGDSCAQWGNLMALSPSLNYAQLAHHYIGSVTPLRHPDSSKWYGRPWRFSRDQLVAYLCGLIVAMDKYPNFTNMRIETVCERLLNMHRLQRFIFAWNTRKNFQYDTLEEHMTKSTPDVVWDQGRKKTADLTGPTVWALELRLEILLKKGWPLFKRMRLWLWDIESLLSSLHWRFRRDNVSRNHMLAVLIAQKYSPTWVSRASFFVTPWEKLIIRWSVHCAVTGEPNTSSLFYDEWKRLRSK